MSRTINFGLDNEIEVRELEYPVYKDCAFCVSFRNHILLYVDEDLCVVDGWTIGARIYFNRDKAHEVMAKYCLRAYNERNG